MPGVQVWERQVEVVVTLLGPGLKDDLALFSTSKFIGSYQLQLEAERELGELIVRRLKVQQIFFTSSSDIFHKTIQNFYCAGEEPRRDADRGAAGDLGLAALGLHPAAAAGAGQGGRQPRARGAGAGARHGVEPAPGDTVWQCLLELQTKVNTKVRNHREGH